MEVNMQHFQHVTLYYFKEGKNATESQKNKVCALYGGAFLIGHVKSGWRSFTLEVGCLDNAHCQVDHLRLLVIKCRLN